jgi:hypothetical protein
LRIIEHTVTVLEGESWSSLADVGDDLVFGLRIPSGFTHSGELHLWADPTSTPAAFNTPKPLRDLASNNVGLKTNPIAGAINMFAAWQTTDGSLQYPFLLGRHFAVHTGFPENNAPPGDWVFQFLAIEGHHKTMMFFR